jgi:hypothetical protein
VVCYRLIDKHIRQLLAVGLTHANEVPVVSSKSETEVSACSSSCSASLDEPEIVDRDLPRKEPWNELEITD